VAGPIGDAVLARRRRRPRQPTQHRAHRQAHALVLPTQTGEGSGTGSRSIALYA
jgi:hypothetical protein